MENKISHGRGNSLRNKVRGWVNLDSPDPLKPNRITTIELPNNRIVQKVFVYTNLRG